MCGVCVVWCVVCGVEQQVLFIMFATVGKVAGAESSVSEQRDFFDFFLHILKNDRSNREKSPNQRIPQVADSFD